MRLPNVSHISLMSVVVIGGGMTFVVGYAWGFDGRTLDTINTMESQLPRILLNDTRVGTLIRPMDSDLRLDWEHFEVPKNAPISRMGMGEPIEYPASKPIPVPGLGASVVLSFGCLLRAVSGRKRVQ